MAKHSHSTETILVRFPVGLMVDLTNAARARHVSIAEVIRERCTPAWTTPQHEEMDLSTVEPEDLGLDSFKTDDSLVRAITQAA